MLMFVARACVARVSPEVIIGFESLLIFNQDLRNRGQRGDEEFLENRRHFDLEWFDFLCGTQ